MFGAWNRDPGQWEAVLSKNRSADLFRRFVGISSPIWGGGCMKVAYVRHVSDSALRLEEVIHVSHSSALPFSPMELVAWDD